MSICTTVHAEPLSDPLDLVIHRMTRDHNWHVPTGVWSTRSLERSAHLYDVLSEANTSLDARSTRLFEHAFGPELAHLTEPGQWTHSLRPALDGGVGTITPSLDGGDSDRGLLSLRPTTHAGTYRGPWSVSATVMAPIDLSVSAADVGAEIDTFWAGIQTPRWTAGFGWEHRWFGPGRRGALVLTNNAVPPPMGTLAWYGPIGPDGRWGKLRTELSMGWMNAPRVDVNAPGLLWIDVRWLPIPHVEIGATRMSLFAGEGRPTPDLWQLILPTQPHVYDDPDQLLPDQDELASLDFRGTLPLSALTEGRISWLEGWWQYGAEDIIKREFASIPYPSLAGIANLYGLEASVGDWLFTFEKARILDDYFRWYTGHRIYHLGFTQNGQPLGHPIGGDAMSVYGRIGWFPTRWGADIWFEHSLTVGVIEALGANLMALGADQERLRVGVNLWKMALDSERWSAGYTFEQLKGGDFIPSATEYGHLVRITWRGAPR